MNKEMWLKRIRNPLFWSALVGFMCQFLQVWQIVPVPDGWQDTFNSLSQLLIILGIWVDPSSPGITDK
ncbi:MAG: phage holin [Bacteroidota bacterium]